MNLRAARGPRCARGVTPRLGFSARPEMRGWPNRQSRSEKIMRTVHAHEFQLRVNRNCGMQQHHARRVCWRPRAVVSRALCHRSALVLCMPRLMDWTYQAPRAPRGCRIPRKHPGEAQSGFLWASSLIPYAQPGGPKLTDRVTITTLSTLLHLTPGPWGRLPGWAPNF